MHISDKASGLCKAEHMSSEEHRLVVRAELFRCHMD